MRTLLVYVLAVAVSLKVPGLWWIAIAALVSLFLDVVWITAKAFQAGKRGY